MFSTYSIIVEVWHIKILEISMGPSAAGRYSRRDNYSLTLLNISINLKNIIRKTIINTFSVHMKIIMSLDIILRNG